MVRERPSFLFFEWGWGVGGYAVSKKYPALLWCKNILEKITCKRSHRGKIEQLNSIICFVLFAHAIARQNIVYNLKVGKKVCPKKLPRPPLPPPPPPPSSEEY